MEGGREVLLPPCFAPTLLPCGRSRTQSRLLCAGCITKHPRSARCIVCSSALAVRLSSRADLQATMMPRPSVSFPNQIQPHPKPTLRHDSQGLPGGVGRCGDTFLEDYSHCPLFPLEDHLPSEYGCRLRCDTPRSSAERKRNSVRVIAFELEPTFRFDLSCPYTHTYLYPFWIYVWV